MAKKQPEICFADTLPVYLRRACSVMSGDGGLRAWLDLRFGEGKWILSDTLRDGYVVTISTRDYADLCVEYGHQKLVEMFGGKSTIPPCPVPLP